MSVLLPAASSYATPTFGEELDFLRQHTEVVLLTNRSGAQVIVTPAWQGRVMTSTDSGPAGPSFGWVNRELIASRKFEPHINVFGGEDRFWLGPEGGQYSIFFAPGAKFDLEHWFTPAPIDTEAYTVVRQSAGRVLCRHDFNVTNYSGSVFPLRVDREVRLLNGERAVADFGTRLPDGARAVAFESINTLRNQGKTAWRHETGLLSIWILGMFNASPATTVVIPFKPGSTDSLGPVVNDTYFGKVPADRLVVRDGVLYFAADANYRSKIGIPPRRAMPVMGSYDAANRVLTLVKYTLPRGATEYVNSMWELQKEPFGGDVVNSYNDGSPPTGGKQLGRFYELESSSPALVLKAGARARHTHQTLHLTGSEAALDQVARKTLGVGLEEIKGALKP